MDISPTNNVSEAPIYTPSSQPVIQPIVPDAQMTDAQKARVDEILLEYKKQEEATLQKLQDTCQRTRDAEIALALERAKLREAELLAERIHTDEATRQSPPNLVSLSYVPPSQRSGSEAATAKMHSHLFAPSSLSSIDSQLLPIPSCPHAPPPERPNVSKPHVSAAASASKGKQRVQSHDKFCLPSGATRIHQASKQTRSITDTASRRSLHRQHGKQ